MDEKIENEISLNNLTSLAKPATNILKYTVEKKRPTIVFPTTNYNPIEIELEGRQDQFIDLKNIQLCVTVALKQANAAGDGWTNLRPERIIPAAGDREATVETLDVVIPYNNFLHSMWSEIQTEMQHSPIGKKSGMYDIISYIKTNYATPIAAKKTLLTSSLWYPDNPGGQNSTDINTNKGAKIRWYLSTASNPMVMQGPLLLDIFNTDRPLPDNVNVRLRFFPNPGNKCCIQPVGQALNIFPQIIDMYLLVPRIHVKPSLLKKSVVLPYKNYEAIRFNHSANNEFFGPRNVITTDVMPRKAFVFVWTENQFNGNWRENRLAFEYHNVVSMLMTLNGEHLPRFGGYQCKWDITYDYDEVYQALFKTIGNIDSIDLKKDDFKQGFVLWCFDLTQKNISSKFYPGKRTGSLDLTIKFDPAPASNLMILVILEDERKLTFDKYRQVHDISAIV